MHIDSKRQLTQNEIKSLARLCKLEARNEADPWFLTVIPGTNRQSALGPLSIGRVGQFSISATLAQSRNQAVQQRYKIQGEYCRAERASKHGGADCSLAR